ncbi:MAG: formylmethanofuran--tetrahydromethanopterin N-formyltransferase [Pseudomonadota bacterium]
MRASIIAGTFGGGTATALELQGRYLEWLAKYVEKELDDPVWTQVIEEWERTLNLLDTDPYYQLGRKVAYFGDGYQCRDERYGRKVWTIPILGGEFVIDRRFGFSDGLMGGNIWYFGEDVDSALLAAERGVEAVKQVPGVIMPFPGGIAGSGSKAGSKYSFMIASTFHNFCPTLREQLGNQSRLPEGVNSVMEIIMNGRDLPTIVKATQTAIEASQDTPGLLRISAGNYGGRLGKSFIYLHPEKQPTG